MREQGKDHAAKAGGYPDQRAGQELKRVVNAHGVVTLVKMPLEKTSVLVAPPTTVT